MLKFIPTALLISVLAVSACAKKSDDIAASYVSPIQYQNYSCRQISEEASRISMRAAQVMGVQDKKATNDATATAVGLIVFWPALFFIRGNAETTAEVARLKGEMETLEQVSIQKNCNIKFAQQTKPAAKVDAKTTTE